MEVTTTTLPTRITIKQQAQQEVKRLMRQWMKEGMIRERVLTNAYVIGGWSRPTCERWYAEIKKEESDGE